MAAAMVLAGEAAFALIRADEACFFQVSPCPDLQGGKVVQLQFALVGVPAIWLVGVLLGAGLRDLPARRRSRDR